MKTEKQAQPAAHLLVGVTAAWLCGMCRVQQAGISRPLCYPMQLARTIVFVCLPAGSNHARCARCAAQVLWTDPLTGLKTLQHDIAIDRGMSFEVRPPDGWGVCVWLLGALHVLQANAASCAV